MHNYFQTMSWWNDVQPAAPRLGPAPGPPYDPVDEGLAILTLALPTQVQTLPPVLGLPLPTQVQTLPPVLGLPLPTQAYHVASRARPTALPTQASRARPPTLPPYSDPGQLVHGRGLPCTSCPPPPSALPPVHPRLHQWRSTSAPPARLPCTSATMPLGQPYSTSTTYSLAHPDIFWLNSRPYWIHSLLGKGGFGCVWKAELLVPFDMQVARDPRSGALLFDEEGLVLCVGKSGAACSGPSVEEQSGWGKKRNFFHSRLTLSKENKLFIVVLRRKSTRFVLSWWCCKRLQDCYGGTSRVECNRK